MVKLIIVGPRCSGKSVLGAYLEVHHKLCHVEASDLMRILFKREAENAETLDEFAVRTLLGNPCAVPNELFSTIHPKPVVLTGLRSLREVDCVQRHIGHIPLVLYVDAFIEVRVARCIARDRPDTSNVDTRRMEEYDHVHASMGLDDIKNLPGAIVLRNNFSLLTEYFAAAESILGIKY